MEPEKYKYKYKNGTKILTYKKGNEVIDLSDKNWLIVAGLPESVAIVGQDTKPKYLVKPGGDDNKAGFFILEEDILSTSSAVAPIGGGKRKIKRSRRAKRTRRSRSRSRR